MKPHFSKVSRIVNFDTWTHQFIEKPHGEHDPTSSKPI
jgi:hypothetical protein